MVHPEVESCGEFNNPSFFVTIKSQAPWGDSAYVLHEKFPAWAMSVGLTPVRTETLSRVDYCFDYHLFGTGSRIRSRKRLC